LTHEEKEAKKLRKAERVKLLICGNANKEQERKRKEKEEKKAKQ
jgi:hypothetical protein